MKHILVVILSAISCIGFSQVPAGVNPNYGDALPIRGFCIAAPQPKEDNPRSFASSSSSQWATGLSCNSPKKITAAN